MVSLPAPILDLRGSMAARAALARIDGETHGSAAINDFGRRFRVDSLRDRALCCAPVPASCRADAADRLSAFAGDPGILIRRPHDGGHRATAEYHVNRPITGWAGSIPRCPPARCAAAWPA